MKVVIGVDDSAESRHAVDTAFDFFGPEADYSIVSIGADLPLYSASFVGGSAISSVNLAHQFDVAMAAAKRNAQDAATQLPLDSEISVEVGHVGHQLCTLAAEQTADAVVIGSQDKSVWQRLLDPSVGRYLIDHAPCPVIVVR